MMTLCSTETGVHYDRRLLFDGFILVLDMNIKRVCQYFISLINFPINEFKHTKNCDQSSVQDKKKNNKVTDIKLRYNTIYRLI